MSVLPPEVAALVERFSRNRDAYRNPAYNEAQTRREFIDPLFKALGWDLDNVSGLAEAYKDVIHEDAIKIGGASKAPDYCFRIGGTRKFFVEAKKPAVGLETDPEPAYQLRRYAWTSKLPLSVLTDFEEFAVYDCRIPPKVGDKPAVARVFYGTCDRYADHWDFIAGLFSKDAVLKGAFDKYAESNKRKKGTAEVDTEFLKQIEAWRLALAQNFALRNPQLSVRDLNFAVQRTIDRLIFLRMCEDRGIEIYGGLQALLNGERVYERLVVLFRRADDKYNSGLFYFTAEAGREPPDTLTLDLTLDDRVLKDIIKSLYYPESPYEFSVLPPEVLGQVYEQFLGKVIRLTAGHHAKVEEKPEVRKAGGVYYTPAYIVDYIVKNTVGKLLEERVPGLGARGLGDKAYADQTLPRPGGMAEGDGPRRAGLPDRKNAAGGGALRTDQPDSAGGGVDTRERGGGAQPDAPGRLPPSSLDSARLAGGTGDAPDIGGPPRSAGPGGGPPDLGVVPARRPAPERAHRRPAKKGARVPRPEPLASIPGSLRILDPACGSGSFLLGAYQFLLNWHRDWYVSGLGVRGSGLGAPAGASSPSPQPRAPDPDFSDRLYQGPGGQWLLTIQEKKRILLNHIYGVDIDPQAVETTKLSLLLKVLEGETEQTIGSTLRLFHERALPDLDKNIKCGNSLIGPDFYDNQQMSLFDEEERLRINAFDWAAEFPEVFQSRDAFPSRDREGAVTRASSSGSRVSGSGSQAPSPRPPTPSPESRAASPGPRAPSPDSGFDAVIGNPPYISMLQLERDLHPDIKPYWKRRFTSAAGAFDIYVLFVEQGVGLLRDGGLLSYIMPNKVLAAEYAQAFRNWLVQNTQLLSLLDFSRVKVWRAAVYPMIPVVQRTRPRPDASILVFTAQEQNTDALCALPPVPAALLNQVPDNIWSFLTSTGARVLFKALQSSVPLESVAEVCGATTVAEGSEYPSLLIDNGPVSAPAGTARFVVSGSIRRYCTTWTIERIQFTHREYHRPLIRLAPPMPARRITHARTPKILISKVGLEPRAYPDVRGEYVGAYTTYVFPGPGASLELLAGLLNSRLIAFVYRTLYDALAMGGGYLRFQPPQMRRVPIMLPDLTSRPGQANHDRLVTLVQQMLDVHKELAAAKTPAAQTALQRQIDATDRQIDQLVYQLYGLTDDEIKIVEEATVR